MTYVMDVATVLLLYHVER